MEALKQPVLGLQRDADAGVLDGKGQSPRGRTSALQGHAANQRELHRIAHQVEQALPQPHRIGAHPAKIIGAVERQRQASGLRLRLQQPEDAAGQLPGVDRLIVQLKAARLDPLEVDDIVEQGGKHLATAERFVEQALA